MQQIDDSFLESVGLGGIDTAKKEAFKQYAQEQLEIRIGETMSNGLSEDQITEFERIIDKDQATVDGWYAQNPDYQSDEMYQKLVDYFNGDESQAKNDYITARWLERNCPNYQDIINKSIDSLKEEISANRDALLASMQ